MDESRRIALETAAAHFRGQPGATATDVTKWAAEFYAFLTSNQSTTSALGR